MSSKLRADDSPQDAPNDGEIVRRCQAGEATAFNELITRYRSKVFTMVYTMVRNEQDTLDLAQEGFLQAWYSIHRFKGQSKFYTWLYRIIVNVTIDTLRRKGVHGESGFDYRIGPGNVGAASRAEFAPALPPDRQSELNEIRQLIDEAIGKLSSEHRAVIVMRELQDLKYNEIAEILDCSIGTVMSRLFYARKKLQILLRDVHENL